MFHSVHKNPITQACLVDSQGEVYPLENPSIIGRSLDCALQMDDPLISRKHIIMQEDSADHWWITDLRSLNGTYVNHQKISKPTLVKHNDSIRIGGKHFIFHAPSTCNHEMRSNDEQPPSGEVFSSLNCWVVMGDVMESSALFQKHAYEEVITEIGNWSHDCSLVINKFGGVVNRFLGDGFLAFWKQNEINKTEIKAMWLELNELREKFSFTYRLMFHYGNLKMDGVQIRGQENLSGSGLNTIFEMDNLASTYQCNQLISMNAAKVFDDEQLEAVSFPEEEKVSKDLYYRTKVIEHG